MLNLLANSTVDVRSGIEQFSQQPVQTSLTPIIADVINGAIIIGALLFLVYLILGAVNWITAGGDKGKIESARAKIIQSLMGLAVLVFAYTFYLFVLNYLGIDLGQPSSSAPSTDVTPHRPPAGNPGGGTGIQPGGYSEY